MLVAAAIILGFPVTAFVRSIGNGEFVEDTKPTLSQATLDEGKISQTTETASSKIFKPNPSDKPTLIKVVEGGKPLFYPVFDKQQGKNINVQATIILPPKFDPNTYSKPIVVLGHDGFDVKGTPDWDPELKVLNFFVKNSIRLGNEIAAQGSLVIVPSYRGENLSEGSRSLVAHDVMDTIAAIRYVKANLPATNKSVVNLVGTSRGALTSVLTASVYPVNKVISGYGVLKFDKWLTTEARCGSDSKCNSEKNQEYPTIKSWENILDDEAIKTAKEAHGGKLPAFTRTAVYISRFANPNTSFYIGQGQNDNSVFPYNATEFAAQLKKLGIPHKLDIYYGSHQTQSDGTHGLYTRLPKYIDSSQGPSLKIMKSSFVSQSSTEPLDPTK